jgi:hypothetical protein
MNVFVTLSSQDLSERVLNVFNGFSFVRNRLEGVDVILDQTTQTVQEARLMLSRFPSDARFFCSLSVPTQWFYMSTLVDERWVLGGPLIPFMKKGTAQCRAELFDGHAEEYFGLPYIPAISYYFEDYVLRHPAKSLYICASLGSGCYWNKCRFCSHTAGGFKPFVRSHVERLLGQIRRVGGKETRFFVGFSSTPPEVLKTILESGVTHRVLMKAFVRADESIIDVVEGSDDLNGFTLVVGAESFSQSINDMLMKGTQWENLLRLIDVTAARGGRVQLDTMEHYPFITEAHLKEADETISRLLELRAKHGRRCFFVLNFGPTVWYDEKQLAQVCDAWHPHTGLLGERWYWPAVSTEAVRLNARMNNMIETRLGVAHRCPRGSYTATLA